jgi:trehalose 6-phosphate phosphatase
MPTPELVAVLSDLRHHLLRIAVISGRDTDALAARLPIDDLILVGNHGLEERNGQSRLLAAAAPFSAPLQRAADAIMRLEEIHVPGVRVERKRAGVSVHFRNATDPSTVQALLRPALERIAAGEQLQLHAGRMVWELRPPLDIDKGEVVRRLAASLRPQAIIYVGDDLTDASAFAALKAMTGTRTLAVGVQSAEVPASTFADCDLIVDGVSGVTRFLRELDAMSGPA